MMATLQKSLSFIKMTFEFEKFNKVYYPKPVKVGYSWSNKKK
jgi:hypothetical protein